MWCSTCHGRAVAGEICHFQTVAAAVLLAAAVAQGSWHVRRIHLLQRVRYRPGAQEKGPRIPAMERQCAEFANAYQSTNCSTAAVLGLAEACAGPGYNQD